MNSGNRREFKIFITEDGTVRILDPDIALIPFIKTVNPGFSIQSAPPPAGYIPNFQRTRRIHIPDFHPDDLQHAETNTLWNIHRRALAGSLSPSCDKDMVNMLEIKEELCRRMYESCTVCPWNCGINRFLTTGRCRLQDEAFFSSIFTHISEEDVINPAINVKLVGCNLDCCYCHTWENLDNTTTMTPLNEHIWKHLHTENATALELVGGEPVVNILAIIEALCFAPYNFNFPIIWNSNGYMNRQTSSLLRGVIDIFLVDIKYGNNDCALRLSGAHHYKEAVHQGIVDILDWGVKTIVRILVLPNHIDCCHKPSMEWLAKFKNRENLWVSILDQYVPEYKAPEIKEMNRYPAAAEIKYVENLIEKNGLKDINKNSDKFWI